jgi:hypothetical protein
MRSLGAVRSSAWTPSVSVWSDSILNVSAALTASKPEDVILLTAPAPAVLTSSHNAAVSWRLSGRGGRPQWLHVGSSVQLESSPAFDGPRQTAAIRAQPVAATASEPEPAPKASRAEKIELAPDLNLSTSGNSVGAAFLALKEQIVATYEGHRTKRGQDSDRARQLAVMDQYIGKTKRHWF